MVSTARRKRCRHSPTETPGPVVNDPDINNQFPAGLVMQEAPYHSAAVFQIRDILRRHGKSLMGGAPIVESNLLVLFDSAGAQRALFRISSWRSRPPSIWNCHSACRVRKTCACWSWKCCRRERTRGTDRRRCSATPRWGAGVLAVRPDRQAAGPSLAGLSIGGRKVRAHSRERRIPGGCCA